jgi:alkylhydroperoxidase family enzyme
MGPQRLMGVTDTRAGWVARLVFWFTRRKVGREWEPLRVAAHDGAVLQAVAGFEAGWQRASALPPSLRALVSIKTSALVGCPA